MIGIFPAAFTMSIIACMLVCDRRSFVPRLASLVP